jgi:tRNA pseudouridine55 synthase
MDGILIIDKPAGITSHDVVARVRRILGTRRVGHTGTLDPFATGVIVAMIGRATRLSAFLDKDEKEYVATVRFGYETDTGDRTGQRSSAANAVSAAELAETLRSVDWEKTLSGFRGSIEQTPPMYSAKKVAGKKLYEYARRGETLERKSVAVTISELELLAIDETEGAAELRVVCSAGTYIRTLAEDIGKAIGTGAHLEELRRTRAGRFALAESITLEELEKLDNPSARMLPPETAVAHLSCFQLSEDRVGKTLNGLASKAYDQGFQAAEPVRMLTPDGRLLGIGVYNETENVVQPKVVLV